MVGPDQIAIPGHDVLLLLGEGGTARVYLARDRVLGRLVAIKVIAEAFSDDAELRARFLREGRVLAELNHPHIVQVYAMGKIDQRGYLVMEYVPGRNLARRILDDRPIPIDETLRITLEVVQALRAAWKRGVIHRDIKPSNILIDEDESVHLADFGLAKPMKIHDDVTVPGGLLLCTPHYLSPEQARGRSDLDYRSDIYSLGIVLYEMLAGERPFRGNSPLKLVAQHIEQPVPDVRVRRPDVAGGLADLVSAMVHKDPSNRPQSYERLEQALSSLRRGDDRAVRTAIEEPLPAFLTEPAARAVARQLPFVGRERELARLGEALDRTMNVGGRMLFVTGEAGTGKTALATEFTRRALDAHPDLVAIYAHCAARVRAADPYALFRELLNLLTGEIEAPWRAGAITREQATRLWRTVPRTVQVLLDEGPDLIGTLVPGDGLLARARRYRPGRVDWAERLEKILRRRRAVAGPVMTAPETLREQCARVFVALATIHPLLVVIDDLHQADNVSLDLLVDLSHRLGSARLQLVGCYRTSEIAPDGGGERHPLDEVVNEVERRQGERAIALPEVEDRAFFDALVDREPNHLDQQFRDALFDRTAGHALFTGELISALQQRGALTQDDDGFWVLGRAFNWGQLPTRVEAVIRERLARLPDDLRRLLTVASVEGEVFTAEVVARVLEQDEHAVIQRLSRQLDRRHRLVRAQGVQAGGGNRRSRYRFSHMLFREYVFARLDRAEQVHLHERIGNALESSLGAAAVDVAPSIAHHFQEAGLTAKAIEYLRQTAARSMLLSAYSEAVSDLQRGLDLVKELPDESTRDQVELELLTDLVPPLIAATHWRGARIEQALTRLRFLSERLGDRARSCHALEMLAGYHGLQQEPARALVESERAVQVAAELGDDQREVSCCSIHGMNLVVAGRPQRARTMLEASLARIDFARAEPVGSPIVTEGITGMLAWLGTACSLMGFPATARGWLRQAVTRAERLEHQHSLAVALLHEIVADVNHGTPDEAESRLARMSEVAAAGRLPFFLLMSRHFQGVLLVGRGQTTEGISLMEEAHETWLALGGRYGHLQIVRDLADAYVDAGRTRAGLRLVGETLACCERTGEAILLAELFRVRGDLLLGQDGSEDRARAERAFQRAVEVARSQQARLWELRAALRLCQLWRPTGREDEARSVLRPVYESFTEGLETRDLRAAREILQA